MAITHQGILGRFFEIQPRRYNNNGLRNIVEKNGCPSSEWEECILQYEEQI